MKDCFLEVLKPGVLEVVEPRAVLEEPGTVLETGLGSHHHIILNGLIHL